MPVILDGFSIPQSLSFLEGSSYTKNNGYLGVVIGVSRAFHPKTQLNDALIEFRDLHFSGIPLACSKAL